MTAVLEAFTSTAASMLIMCIAMAIEFLLILSWFSKNRELVLALVSESAVTFP